MKWVILFIVVAVLVLLFNYGAHTKTRRLSKKDD